MKKNTPWYDQHDYYVEKAVQGVGRLQSLARDSVYKSEIETIKKINIVRLIYESNLMEGAGVKSESDTKKLIDEHLSQVKITEPEKFSIATLSDDIIQKTKSKEFRKSILQLHEFGVTLESIQQNLDIKVSFKGKTRGAREVERHYTAFQRAEGLSIVYGLTSLFFHKYTKLNDQVKDIKLLNKLREMDEPLLEAINFMRKKYDPKTTELKIDSPLKTLNLLTEKQIKKIHKIIATDLMPDDTDQPAGEYRNDARHIDHKITFMAPELVPKAMKEFVKFARVTMKDYYEDQINIFEAAAKISFRFVKIHPFPDFNGRMSRLILNMVLMSSGIPFPAPLRVSKKRKGQYLLALRRADGDNIKPYTTLIAMNVVQTLEEMDEHLKLAGLKTIY